MQRFNDSIPRMIDANLNRCREGIRVMEDIARFVLNNAALSARLKNARHGLRAAIESLPLTPDSLLQARDSAADVGTTINTAAEHQRPNADRDMLSAAAKRSTEALRVIEESAKALNAPAAPFEALRYALYDLERDLHLALTPPCPQWTLCVLITRDACTHHSPEDIVSLAAEGGADCIQIREKAMPDAEFLPHAAALSAHAHALGLHVVINDRVHIAKLVNADAVHLGQDDLPIHAARTLLGAGTWIGRTCPTIAHAVEAVGQGADMCGLGPVFPSSTKAKPDLAGTALISDYLANPVTRNTPMLAISGITPSNIDRLAAIACPGVAVSASVCASPDPRAAARAIAETINARREPSSATISP